MSFNPALPANNSPVVSQELRDQFNGLKALIDAQQTQIAALQAALPACAHYPNVGDLSIGFDDPPSQQNLEDLQDYIQGLVNALKNG